MAEMTALGAAMLAGLAVGVWPSLESIELNTSNDRFVPQMAADGTRQTMAIGRSAMKIRLAVC